MTFQKRVRSGQHLPKGYGFAWAELHKDTAVCYPLPFNVLARWLYHAYWWLVAPQSAVREVHRELYEAGYHAGQNAHSVQFEHGKLAIATQAARKEGYKDGYEAGFRDHARGFQEAFDAWSSERHGDKAH